MYKINKIENEVKRIKRIKRISSLTIYIIFIPIILFQIVIGVKSVLQPQKIASCFGISDFLVLSGSMEPGIMTGDLIISKNVDEDDVKIGDVVTFQINNEVITHRIVDSTEKDGKLYYTTKGDNNNTADLEPITYENIVGRYVAKIDRFGKLVDVIKSKITLVVLILIVFLTYWINSEKKRKFLRRKLIRERYNREREKRKCSSKI